MTEPESIFAAALGKEGSELREFLKQACGSNLELRREVESLIQADRAAGSFLETPAVERPEKSFEQIVVSGTDSSLESRQWTDLPAIGNYEIHGRLGQGGMGTVYLARHAKLNKDVALKVLRVGPHANHAKALARFDQELQAIGRLDHPNIVRALDAGELDGTVYLSMELLKGVDLDYAAGKIAEGGALTIADACEIACQAASGLHYAHEQGLVHRDVKPSNLMLTDDPLRQVCVKVLDLGLAAMPKDHADERITAEGVAMGTVLYMAPEQATDTKSVDHRADIYALGASLYRLIVGRPPFRTSGEDSPASVLLALATKTAPSLGDAKPDAPEALVQLVAQMLERDPARRPQNLYEVIRVLQPLGKKHELPKLLSVGLAAKLKEQTAEINLGELRETRNTPSIDLESQVLDGMEVLRRRVQKFWVDGVLARTEESQEMLSLQKEIRTDAVINPWEGVTEIPLNSTDAQWSIEEVFSDSEQSLLILGQPGAGKSTTLLQLTRTLIRQNKASKRFVPVVLHLSTWTDPNQALEEWIAQEISVKYQIPRWIGNSFVTENRLLLLLDGLDEVSLDLQADCVKTINRFLENFTPAGIVVSCRAEDYQAIGLRLKLHGAVLLQPFSVQQIQTSLSDGSSHSLALLDSLQKHESLMDLAKSPLMLSVIKLGFSDSTGDNVEHLKTPEHTEAYVFETFIDRMFRSKGKTEQGYSKQVTLDRLGWLAKQMETRNQSVLLIEQLQPSWLETRGQQMLYALILSIGLGLGCAIVTAFWWHYALLIMAFGATTSHYQLLWLFFQLPVWLMMISAIDFRFFKSLDSNSGQRSRSALHVVYKTLLYWSLWMLWPLVGWLTGIWGIGWLVSEILIGLSIGSMVAFIGRRRRLMADIGTVEALGVSARKSFVGWLWGLLVGYCVYLVYLWLWAHLLLDRPPEWFPYYWQSMEEIYHSITWPLVGGSCGMVVGGLVPKVLDRSMTPNQGMQMSLRNAIIAGVFSLVVIWVTTSLILHYGVTIKILDFEIHPVLLGASFSVWSSFFITLIFGGWDLLKHLLTRHLLVRGGQLPADFKGFLSYVTHLSFLKRAGGAYLFNHKLLLKHFANRQDQSIRG